MEAPPTSPMLRVSVRQIVSQLVFAPGDSVSLQRQANFRTALQKMGTWKIPAQTASRMLNGDHFPKIARGFYSTSTGGDVGAEKSPF